MTTRIVAIVIFAVNRKLRVWAQANVREKSYKILTPSIANNNAPVFVVSDSLIRSSGAASFKVLPRQMFGRAGYAVHQMRLAGSFFIQTATRLRDAASQIVLTDYNRCAANTETTPSAVSNVTIDTVRLRFAEHCQSAIRNIKWYIDSGWHVLSLQRLQNTLVRLAQGLQPCSSHLHFNTEDCL